MSVDNSAVEQAADATETAQNAASEGAVSVYEATNTPPQTGTILGSDPTEKPVAAPASWPDDWRAKIAGEDAKELARLQRMNSPADLYKSYRALEAKLAEKAGPKSLAPPENATPEQMAAWRKDMGLPETAEGYVPQLPEGVVLGEADKPLVDAFREVAYKANMTPTQFNEALKWYYGEIDAMTAKQSDLDRSFRMQSEDNLRAEFGPEYRANLTAVNNTLSLFFGDNANEILAARTPSGKMLGDSPEFIKSMALLARELNPAMPHIPVGNGTPSQAIGSRISEIEKMMADRNSDYWRDEKIQAEYRDLVEAREKYGARAA